MVADYAAGPAPRGRGHKSCPRWGQRYWHFRNGTLPNPHSPQEGTSLPERLTVASSLRECVGSQQKNPRLPTPKPECPTVRPTPAPTSVNTRTEATVPPSFINLWEHIEYNHNGGHPPCLKIMVSHFFGGYQILYRLLV